MLNPDKAPLQVSLSADGTRVIMVKALWRGEFPVEHLSKWLKVYRDLRDRRQGAFRRFYAEDVRALEAIEEQLKCPTI